jgi:hypothetical protein
MRTLIFLAMFAGVTAACCGQGTVNFSAGASVATRAVTNSGTGGATTGQMGPASAGYSYYFALFVADSTITSAGTPTGYGALDPTLTAGWSVVTWNAGNPAGATGIAYATNTTSGRFTGNPTTDDVFVSGRAGGSSASFVIVGWSSDVAGQDWNSAETWIDFTIQNGVPPTPTGWTGASGVATSVALGVSGLTPPGGLFGAGPGEISNGIFLQAQPVPEPSTFAFAGLGAATLLIFRRARRQHDRHVS